MKQQHIVYIAINTINGKCYIGMSSNGLQYRRRRHITLAYKGHRGCPRFYDAIRKYGAEVFVWRIIKQYSSREDAFNGEVYFVKQFKPKYNVTNGGSGTPNLPAHNRKKVICLEDGLIYESATSAGCAYNIISSEVSANCRNKRHVTGGRHFRYFVKHIPESERKSLITLMDRTAALNRYRVKTLASGNSLKDGKDKLGRSAAGPQKQQRAVICNTDGRMFDSASSAAEYYRVCKSSLIELCLGKNGRRTVGGLKFSYLSG